AGGEALSRAAQDGDAAVRVAVDIEPDARHLGMRVGGRHGELAFLAHDDLEDAGLERPDFQIAIGGIVHGPFYNLAMVSFDDVAAAHERLKGAAQRTPVLTSATVNELTGAQVFFKCENFQRMGAFKFRGAYNALS